jgi:hypothetical protein
MSLPWSSCQRHAVPTTRYASLGQLYSPNPLATPAP